MVKNPYSKVVIIYNPNSTGSSKANAKKLQQELKESLSIPVTLTPTSHAGHGEEIAEKLARSNQRIVLVSSSGDGGYNEVINGVLKISDSKLVTHVLPSGNANDHHHATTKGSSAERIAGAHETAIDVIKVSGTKDGKPWQRYAHSYVGIGLTAYVGKRLTEATLNPLNEKLIVLKYVALFRHVTIRIQGKKRRYTSLVFGSVDRMSKVLKLRGTKSLGDGKMEVYEIRERNTLQTFLTLIGGSTAGFSPSMRTDLFSFRTVRATEIQLDGEVFKLDADTDVTVTCHKQALKIIR